MSKNLSRATVTGSTLSGSALKSYLTALWDALQSSGITDAARATVSASTTLTQSQCGPLLVDATSASIVLTLPTSGATTDEALYFVRRIDASNANSVTIQRGGTDTIEGASSTLLVPPGATIALHMPAGATNWRVLYRSGGTPAGARANIGASASPFRNVIINGGIDVDQRNSGASQTFTAGAALAYCVDRFYGYCTGANVSGQQITGSDGTMRYRFTGAASVTAIGLGHRVEARNSRHLAGAVATLSVRLANTLLTSVSWALYYANSADTFGTLASPTRTAIASGTFTGVSSTEAVQSVQVNIPAGATTGLELVLSVGAQTSGTWTIGEVQIEAGAIPTQAIAFERVDYGVNLARCQRYFYKHASGAATGYNGTGLIVYGDVKFPVDMRTSPTIALSGHSTSNAANATAGTTTSQFVRLQTTITSGPGAGFAVTTVDATAEL